MSSDGEGVRARLPRALRSPTEAALEISTAAASLPVVGRLFRPLGALTAGGLWTARQLPGL
ncbi:MAG: hypothetical protein JWO60_767, partial [Frankiales bacterium]|nr:hypothetical protein [Frankiales bacterium]